MPASEKATTKAGHVARRLPSLKEDSLQHRVYRAIKDAIYLGRLLPGEHLRELQLAAELQVSQATVREALLRLEQSGLVVRTPHRGTHVTKLSPKQLHERLDLRCLLEGIAAVEAAKNISEADFDELRQLEKTITKALSAGVFFEVYQADFKFHRLIWQRSQNETLCQMLELLAAPMFAFMSVLRTHSPSRWPGMPHSAITKALEQADPEVIRTTLKSHIRGSNEPFLHLT